MRKQKEKLLKLEREKYANDLEKKAKKKELYQKQKESKQMKRQENLSLASKGLNCNSKTEEPEDPEIKDSEMQCEFCRKQFDLSSILKHIANTEECRLFYGPRLEQLKKEYRRQRKEFYRKEDGIEKELKKQREKYASQP